MRPPRAGLVRSYPSPPAHRYRWRMSKIGQRLRHARAYHDFTIEQLEQRAGVEPGTVERLESATRSNKRDAAPLERLAVSLGVRAEWLARGAPQAEQVTAENCLRAVPFIEATIQGRPALWLAAPETFVEIVVGINYRREAFAAALDRRELARGPAWMIPDPMNPHDPNSVRIVLGEQHVGFLGRERAAPWQPIILALQAAHHRYVAVLAEAYWHEDAARVDIFVPVHLGSRIEL